MRVHDKRAIQQSMRSSPTGVRGMRCLVPISRCKSSSLAPHRSPPRFRLTTQSWRVVAYRGPTPTPGSRSCFASYHRSFRSFISQPDASFSLHAPLHIQTSLHRASLICKWQARLALPPASIISFHALHRVEYNLCSVRFDIALRRHTHTHLNRTVGLPLCFTSRFDIVRSGY
jgi:hypothetical protein